MVRILYMHGRHGDREIREQRTDSFQIRSTMSSPLNDEFIIPTLKAVGATKFTGEEVGPCTYLAGNSLGALSKRSERYVQEELRVWGTS